MQGELTQLGGAVDQLGYLGAEPGLNLGDGYVAVFRDVVEQRRRQCGGVELLVGQDKRYLQRVLDIGFARLAHLPFMRLGGEGVSILHQRQLLCRQVCLYLLNKLGQTHG